MSRRQIPKLNRPMVLEALDESTDAGGGLSGGWTALGTLWVAVETARGRTQTQAGRDIPVQAVRLITRGAPIGSPRRPEPGQRLRDGLRNYAVLAVTEWDAAGWYLEITAQEGRP
ncbi:head-tail adaptor [Rubricella aquisinus]|uniref:Head-tail adaptor n=1 Tax=Rubricella aquisinus TaxID=2028108 RepID=A0A840X3X1_9RHOB|nr:head-tail adaptor protein [Rubricella aquisinus]MBB5516535.1 head-tail adaptor [Rubricella aquisinus]